MQLHDHRFAVRQAVNNSAFVDRTALGKARNMSAFGYFDDLIGNDVAGSNLEKHHLPRIRKAGGDFILLVYAQQHGFTQRLFRDIILTNRFGFCRKK